jgi:hypothetical protein
MPLEHRVMIYTFPYDTLVIFNPILHLTTLILDQQSYTHYIVQHFHNSYVFTHGVYDAGEEELPQSGASSRF